MKLMWPRVISALVVAMLFGAFASVSVFAQSAPDSSSDNYGVTNTFFGAGGQDACSDNFCSHQTLGDTAVGESSSANWGVVAGSQTTHEAILEVEIDGITNNLGILSEDTTATATNTLSVRSYLSSGYVVQLVGTPPKINAHTLTNLSVPTASQAGTEQFGVNMRQNTSPSVGAEAVQFPDETFAYGLAAPNYGTQNLFAYNDKDIIAQSDQASGRTDYTLSIIVNISPNTPAGLYTTKLHAVVVPMY